MKHITYHEHQELYVSMKDRRIIHDEPKGPTLHIILSAVGIQPRLVSASWSTSQGTSGIAYGGFQSDNGPAHLFKDFDFQTAAAMAIENAIARGIPV